MNTMNKTIVVFALRKFINQRSGIEHANYNDRESFMRDYNRIANLGRQARALLRAVQSFGISDDQILEASKTAYSGRLQFVSGNTGYAIQYTAGQYFPTEYRAAACAVLARCLWDYWRKNMPAIEVAKAPATYAPGIVNCGDYIRNMARNELGRAIAREWFS